MNALEKEVLRYIGEDPDNPDVFTDDDTGLEPIRNSINDCIEELTLVSGSRTVTFPVPLVADQMWYRIKAQHGSFAWVTSAWLVNEQRELEQTDLIQLGWFNPRFLLTSGQPESYLPVGADVIGFYPRPSASSDIVELTCVLIPRRYASDTDPVQVIAGYRRACVHYAVSEYWASRGAANDALDEFAKYISIAQMHSVVPASAEAIVQASTQKRGQGMQTRTP